MKIKREKLNTFTESIEDLQSIVSVKQKLYLDLVEEFKKEYNQKWFNDGGCKDCMGFKYESILEIKNNKFVTKEKTFCKSCNGKCDNINLVYAAEKNINKYSYEFNSIITRLYGKIIDDISNLSLQIHLFTKWNRLHSNKLVVVSKGRKFPIGMKGKVLKIITNQFGSSTKIRTESGEEVLVDSNNLEILNCEENKF